MLTVWIFLRSLLAKFWRRQILPLEDDQDLSAISALIWAHQLLPWPVSTLGVSLTQLFLVLKVAVATTWLATGLWKFVRSRGLIQTAVNERERGFAHDDTGL